MSRCRDWVNVLFIWNASCVLSVCCLGTVAVLVWGHASELLACCLSVFREPSGCGLEVSGIQYVCCLRAVSPSTVSDAVWDGWMLSWGWLRYYADIIKVMSETLCSVLSVA